MRSLRTLSGAFFICLATPIMAGGEELRVPLPPNVTIHESVRTHVEEGTALSPTLQRQLGAIASARARLDIRVSPVPLPGFRRAETTIKRYTTGFITAEIVVPPGLEFFELLAHELEHVLEQIERVDLATLVRRGLATRDARGIFETARARDVGLSAALEIEEGLRALRPAH